MDQNVERRIRDRAYSIWEEEGRPAGRDVEHWLKACQEVAAEDGTAGGDTAEGSTAEGGNGESAAEGGAASASDASNNAGNPKTRKPRTARATADAGETAAKARKATKGK